MGSKRYWPLGRVRVEGPSMQPTYRPGSFLLVWWGRRRPRVGTVVVARHPLRAELLVVKRVVRVLDSGELWVHGDNPAASEDSRTFGPLPGEAVLGRVLCRYYSPRAAREVRPR